jgi:hypothetical protein
MVINQNGRIFRSEKQDSVFGSTRTHLPGQKICSVINPTSCKPADQHHDSHSPTKQLQPLLIACKFQPLITRQKPFSRLTCREVSALMPGLQRPVSDGPRPHDMS